MKNLIICIIIFTILNSCFLQDDNPVVINRYTNVITPSTEQDGWLLMVYMSATGTLEEESIGDISNIKEGFLSHTDQDNIDIVILHDRGPGYSTLDGDWTGTYLYKVTLDGLEVITEAEGWRTAEDQEENMGSISTLDNFISWGKSQYKRKKNALVIWNHGGGLSGQTLLESRAVSWDTENTGEDIDDALYINEIQTTLKKYYNSQSKLEILGFDACYMGMVEIAYEFRDEVEYMVASAGLETGGWRYNDFIPEMVQQSTPATVSEKVVESYKTFSEENSLENTLAVLELSHVEDLKTEIDTLLTALTDENKAELLTLRDSSYIYYDKSLTNDDKIYPYIDFGYLLNQCESITGIESELVTLNSTLKELINSSFSTNSSLLYDSSNGDRGLSIFFTEKAEDYQYQWWYTSEDTGTFGLIDFCGTGEDYSLWKLLMDSYFLEI